MPQSVEDARQNSQALSAQCCIWRHFLTVLLQGDPSAVPQIVENIKALLGQKPMFGICMGHQILGQVRD